MAEARPIQAIRYGDASGYWIPNAPVMLASFVLGLDVDTRTTSLNEHMLDVVRPMSNTWDPPKKADVTLVDKKHGTQMLVRLGDLVVRLDNGRLGVIKHEVFEPTYVVDPIPRSFEEDLSDLLDKHNKSEGWVANHALTLYLSRCLNTLRKVMQ